MIILSETSYKINSIEPATSQQVAKIDFVERDPIHYACNSCERKKCNRCVAAQLAVMRGENTGKPFIDKPDFHCSCFRSNPEAHLTEAQKQDLTPKPFLKIADLNKINPNTKFDRVFEVDD